MDRGLKIFFIAACFAQRGPTRNTASIDTVLTNSSWLRSWCWLKHTTGYSQTHTHPLLIMCPRIPKANKPEGTENPNDHPTKPQ